MAAQKIGYANKQSGALWTSSNANEVKDVVNSHADNIDSLSGSLSTARQNIVDLQTTMQEKADRAFVARLSYISETTDGFGFYLTDSAGNTVLRYDANGLDAALLSEHLMALIKDIDGLGTTEWLENTVSALSESMGSMLESIQVIEAAESSLQALASRLQSAVRDVQSTVRPTDDSAFSVADGSGNMALRYDSGGLDAAMLSEHLKSLIRDIDGIGDAGGLEERVVKLEGKTGILRYTDEPGLYLTDANGWVARVVEGTEDRYGFVARSERLIDI